MADTPIIPMGDDIQSGPAAAGDTSYSPDQPKPARLWQRGARLSSVAANLADRAEAFLADAGFDRAPWLAVIFACGILTWFGLASPWQWASGIGLGVLLALAALAVWPLGGPADETRGHLRSAIVACALVFAAGLAVIWARSEMVGAEPIDRPVIQRVPHSHRP